MSPKDSNPKIPGTPVISLTGEFNAETIKGWELEAKDLVVNNNPQTFPKIENYLMAQGWVRSVQRDRHIITRQIDTPERTLFQADHDTLRNRAECEDNNLDKMSSPDICFKTKNGGMLRGEYETGHAGDFERIHLKPLLEKYPADAYPDLHKRLAGIKEEELMEHFRIDVIRTRLVVDLPESVTGLKGKQVYIEHLQDSIAYVLDLPELAQPLVIGYEREREAELLFKQCSYDKTPDAHKHICSPMSRAEAEQVQEKFREVLYAAVPGELVRNEESKAERGFKFLDKVYAAMDKRLEKIRPTGKLDHVHHLNGVDADGKLVDKPAQGPASIFKLVSLDFRAVSAQHTIATRQGPIPANNNGPLVPSHALKLG